MNERIKQLFEQALEEFNAGPVFAAYIIPDPIKEKFAELIVKECVAQIEIERGNPYRNMGDVDANGVSACVESIRRIKEHFGVKE
jgi:hypothetical protein